MAGWTAWSGLPEYGDVALIWKSDGNVVMSTAPSNRVSPNGFAGAALGGHPATQRTQHPRSKRFWLWALLLQRCPRCREGKIFKGVIAMNDPCPSCRLVFKREPGYFLGALYFSYALGVVIILPLFFLFQRLLPEWSDMGVAAAATIAYLPLTTIVFRYARVLWIYFDRHNAASEPLIPPI
jgi:uncharacterized protein (DUF983 family)